MAKAVHIIMEHSPTRPERIKPLSNSCIEGLGNLLAFLHLFDKGVKQVIGIVGAWKSLWMVLHRKNRQLPVFEAFDGIVV